MVSRAELDRASWQRSGDDAKVRVPEICIRSVEIRPVQKIVELAANLQPAPVSTYREVLLQSAVPN